MTITLQYTPNEDQALLTIEGVELDVQITRNSAKLQKLPSELANSLTEIIAGRLFTIMAEIKRAEETAMEIDNSGGPLDPHRSLSDDAYVDAEGCIW